MQQAGALQCRVSATLHTLVTASTSGLTAAPSRCGLVTEVLVILVFVGLWGNKIGYLKLGQSQAIQDIWPLKPYSGSLVAKDLEAPGKGTF